VEWFSLFLELACWHPHSASPFWNSASSSFCCGHRTFWIRFEPSPPGKLWPTPPHRCHASIRTLNGPLKGPVQVGVRSNTQVHHCRDEPGIVGAAIYRAILIDQHSLRSHPNKAVDVVVCQTSWIDFGSRFINFGPASTTKSRGDGPLAFGLFPLPPGRLGCRRDRCRHRVVQRLVHLSTHPQPV
jgi:hypothetical protein